MHLKNRKEMVPRIKEPSAPIYIQCRFLLIIRVPRSAITIYQNWPINWHCMTIKMFCLDKQNVFPTSDILLLLSLGRAIRASAIYFIASWRIRTSDAWLSGIGIDSGMIQLLTGIGIGIKHLDSRVSLELESETGFQSKPRIEIEIKTLLESSITDCW